MVLFEEDTGAHTIDRVQSISLFWQTLLSCSCLLTIKRKQIIEGRSIMKSLSHRPVTSFHSLKLLHAHIPAWDLKINPKSFFSCVTMKLHKYGRFNIAIMARARILNVDRSQSSSPSSVSSSISSASSSSS